VIREDVKESLDAYAKEGRPTGGFLEAVLSNDLMGALGRADLQNRYDIFDICSYVYNHCPANCHGSPARVTLWLRGWADKREAERAKETET
jgi:hypothetical protein